MTTANHRPRGSALVLALLATLASACAPAPETTEDPGVSPDQEALASIERRPHKAVCGVAAAGFARCHAHVRTLPDGETVVSSATPQGLTPASLQSAYEIPAGGTGTVAIVDAQDDPNAESDLAVYRAQFGLPACTTANGCFRKVNQNGQTSPLPSGDTGWGGEISLDLDMVSAACPGCRILLVEASSATNDDLGAAVNTAAAMGASAISNSYGGGEFSGETSYDTEYYDHPGILITASSGDGSYGVEYPAAGQFVLAVGGTSLAASTSARGWAEAAWSGAGSGCSAYEGKPGFQKDAGCGNRTVADVSAIADPSTGVAVYDTYGGSGWQVYGGTSVASPLVASILVAAGKGGVSNAWPYANTADFYDVTTGSNGTCSGSAAYLCNAEVGYDGPTGLGTPNGAAIKGGGGGGGGSAALAVGGTYIFETGVDPTSCMDVYGDGPANLTQVEEYTCNGSAAQSFTVVDAGNGLVSLVNPGSGRCLDFYAAGTADGTKVEIYDCNGTAAQQFAVESDGGGYVTFMNPNSGKCLDVAGSGTANLTQVQLRDCNGTSAQKWHPVAGGLTVGGSYGFHTLVNPTSCMDVYEDGPANLTQVEEYACNSSSAQAFTVVDAGDGLVTLLHASSGRCVDLYAAGTTDGTKVEIYDCNGTVAQQFAVATDAAGNLTFINPNSGKCLDIASSGTANLTSVQLWDCNGTSAQKWKAQAH